MEKKPTTTITTREYWEKWVQHFTVGPIDESLVISASDGEVAYSLETESIYFGDESSREDMLRQVTPTPTTLGYLIWLEKYDGVDICKTVLPDKTLNAAFHLSNPIGRNQGCQPPCRFTQGEKVLVVLDAYDAVVPCEVIGPITTEMLNEEYEQFHKDNQTFDDYLKEMVDWQRDRIALRPLVRLRSEYGYEMRAIELEARVNIFPYKKFDI